jgi:hypothetical protein
VYSLGATLYHLLTGRTPVDGLEAHAAMDRVRRGELPPPRAVQPGVPRALEAVCLKAMALRPEDRYPTPLALAEELEHWLADEPVGAYPEPVAVRARRWLRRHRTLVTTAAAVLVVGVAGLAGFAAVVSGKNRELEDRNQQLDRQKQLAEEQRNRALTAEQAARDEAANAKQSEAETKAALEFFQVKVLAAARPRIKRAAWASRRRSVRRWMRPSQGSRRRSAKSRRWKRRFGMCWQRVTCFWGSQPWRFASSSGRWRCVAESSAMTTLTPSY